MTAENHTNMKETEEELNQEQNNTESATTETTNQPEAEEQSKAEETEENTSEETTAEETTDESPSKEEELMQQLSAMQDKYLRLSADFDNYRKRTLKEKMDLTKTAGEKTLLEILPVVDNFERALASLDAAQDINAVKDGIHHIYNSFGEFLKQQGIQEIEAKEQAFDTDVHEAITKIPAPSEELKGKVVDVIQKGYFLNEKVIRFSKVVVGE